ncbi:D-serine dehydratase [Bacillus cereus]|uniref:D-serine dehydratase n=1 Tax=Bacillus cereus TaxID=1396 RepID=A0A0G8EQU0_BACCE|nr:D-serine dehydratase [Bacillus cereus]
MGRASGFVGKTIEPFLSGIYTISDNHLYKLLKGLVDAEGIELEPSALVGMIGSIRLYKEGKRYITNNYLTKKLNQGIHIVWGTGGVWFQKR